MNIVCIGGGPSGLYFALLMKQQDPANEVTVVERNRPYDTFGWGVVFSDQTLGNLQAADPVSAAQILDSFSHWDDIEVNIRGHKMRSGGHGFCGIGRKRLLNILQQRCEEVGVKLVFETDVKGDEQYPDADLIIASDGLNSRIRTEHAATYKPTSTPALPLRVARHSQALRGLHLRVRRTETRLVPGARLSLRRHHVDLHRRDARERVARRRPRQDGEGRSHRLLRKALREVPRRQPVDVEREPPSRLFAVDQVPARGVRTLGASQRPCAGRADGRCGTHRALFDRLGTKLALEDSIELARSIAKHPGDLNAALQHYEDVRAIEVLRIQNAARNSTEWFEHVDRYVNLPPEQFAYSLLTRSQRISHENLRLRDKAYVEGYEDWIAERAGVHRSAPHSPIPPMFTPFKARDITLKNRIVVSPMAQYSCVDGMPADYHLVHLGARAMGGAGMVVVEMTCTSPEARITPGCPGLWNVEQRDGWKRIVDFVHSNSDAKIALQIGHSGAKGSTRLAWEGIDQPLESGNWELISASPQQYLDGVSEWSRAMTRTDMDRIRDEFVRSTRYAAEAGFDWLELHCAHGYLLSSFISPLTNQRTDEYGGSLANRLRYPLEVFAAVREVWPQHLPMSVRISANDWVEGGITPDDAVEIARAFKAAGADMIDCSSGQVSKKEHPVFGRMFQTPFADRVRNEAGIATIAVGAISEADHVNSIIAAGRADLCAVARPHLANPAWTLMESAKIGYTEVAWPKQYRAAKSQLERNLERERAAQAQGAGGSAIEQANRALGV